MVHNEGKIIKEMRETNKSDIKIEDEAAIDINLDMAMVD